MHDKLAKSLVAMLLIGSTSAFAENTDLSGSYSLIPGQEESIQAAVDATAEGSNFIIRPIVRSRLQRANIPPYQKITLDVSARAIVVTTDKRPAITTTAGGKPFRWTSPEGSTLNLSTSWHGSELDETLEAGDGKRVNRYSLTANGKALRMHVVITSPKLSAPLVYTLLYERN